MDGLMRAGCAPCEHNQRKVRTLADESRCIISEHRHGLPLITDGIELDKLALRADDVSEPVFPYDRSVKS